jgi:PASTA domain/Glucodextranase, domain B
MRARPLLAVTCLAPALVAGGCGGDDEPRAARALERVELAVTAPTETVVVRNDAVVVEGTVSPARAQVLVVGEPAEVTGGRFSASAPLEPGSNVIDVIATASGREPAMTAIRVTREVSVTVPDLEDLGVDEVESALGDVGLRAAIEEDREFFDEFLPEDPSVCAQDPEPGTEVRRGSTVHVIVSKSC